MRKILFIIVLSLLPSLVVMARETVNLNRGWMFCRGDQKPAATPSDIPAHDMVNLPHDFQISQEWVAPSPDEMPDLSNPVANIKSRLSARGFKEMGSGWYYKILAPDSTWRDRRVLLDFEGLLLRGDVYLNGEHIGGTDYGYLGMEMDISERLRYDGENVISVCAETGTPENSRWYTGAGLYRDVNIILVNPVTQFARHPLKVTTDMQDDSTFHVAVKAEISTRKKGHYRISTRLMDMEGNEVAAHTVPLRLRRAMDEYTLDTIGVTTPHLWDCDNPYLYTLEVAICDTSMNVLDSVSSRIGLRTLEYTPDSGLLLNGKKVLLKGIANHHTLGALGAAAFPDAMEKRIRLLKEFGFNHIRTSHNPYSSSLLDLCDRYGILVVDELYDKWLTRYAGGRRDWMELWIHDIPEWVKRDRNHPSVIMWSLGNELQTLWDIPFHDYGVTPYRMQKALLHRYDTTRPVTVAMHPRGRNHHTDSLPADLALETDIAAYNYRYMYFPGDSRRFPWLMFYQSEANTSGMGANFFGMDLDRVIGLAYWGAIDYLGESQGWPAKGWDKGMFDISLHPKPQAWYLRSYFKPDEPMVHIAIEEKGENTMWNDVNVGVSRMADHWNFNDGDVLTMYTYTNADEVELKINGRSMGRKSNTTGDPSTRNAIRWDSIPYRPGSVEAIAYTGGRKVADHKVHTAGKAVRLIASVDESDTSWKADGMSLRHLSVKAVDSRGNVVPYQDASLRFSIEGPAEIAGVINGDMTSGELYTATSRRLYQGRATAILRSTVSPGPVKIHISAPGFRPVILALATEN